MLWLNHEYLSKTIYLLYFVHIEIYLSGLVGRPSIRAYNQYSCAHWIESIFEMVETTACHWGTLPIFTAGATQLEEFIYNIFGGGCCFLKLLGGKSWLFHHPLKGVKLLCFQKPFGFCFCPFLILVVINAFLSSHDMCIKVLWRQLINLFIANLAAAEMFWGYRILWIYG